MLKRFMSVLLTVCILITALALSPFAVTAADTASAATGLIDPDNPDYEYKVVNGAAIITGWVRYGEVEVIPSSLGGYPVEEIAKCTGRYVVIPETVKKIGDGAFRDSQYLDGVFLPDSLKEIGDLAFARCHRLRSVIIPSTVETIGEYAFGYKLTYNPDTGKFDLPEKDDGFKIYGWEGSSAEKYAEQYGISFVALKDNGEEDYEYEVKDDGTAEITAYNGTGGEITIPSTLGGHTVTSVASSTFDYYITGTKGIRGITVPDTVRSFCYSGSSDLYKLTVPDTLTSIRGIGRTAWYYVLFENQPDGVIYVGKIAYALKGECPDEVVIKDGTVTIGAGLFGRSSYKTEDKYNYLKKIVMPDSVISIETAAFSLCYSLTEAVIPDSVETIGDEAFYRCERLTELVIPASVTSIGEDAFSECVGLNSITVEAGNKVYDSRDNCGALIETSTNKLIRGCNNSFIPPTVTEIGDDAFSFCKGLTELVIPDSVAAIDQYAFLGCTGLTCVTVPKSVKTIERVALGYTQDEDHFYPPSKYDFTIFGYEGTAAEKYAESNGLTFVALEPEKKLGDADGSGEVDAADATVVQRAVTLISVPYEVDQLMCADIDGDGDLTIVDATFIQRYSTRVAIPYAIGEAI